MPTLLDAHRAAWGAPLQEVRGERAGGVEPFCVRALRRAAE